MAKVVVGHHPELTPQEAMEVFRRHFAGRYEAYMIQSKLIPRDFAIKKSTWTAVLVRLEQKPDQTVFNFIGTPPSAVVRALLIGFLILFWPLIITCQKMESEIRLFIENAEEFK